MASKNKRGPGAMKTGPQQRADANARIENSFMPGRSSKDAAKVRRGAASGPHMLDHGEMQRAAPNSPRHGG